MFTIETAKLAAVFCFVGKDARRPQLECVFVDPAGYIVGTTGSVACAAKLDADCGQIPAAGFSMAAADVAALVKAANAQKVGLIEFELVAIELVPRNVRAASVRRADGQYPDWRRVFPQAPCGIAANFNPELLMALFKARRALGYSANTAGMIRLHQNGSGAAVAILHPGVHAVVMPLREVEALGPVEYEGLL